MGDIQDIFSTFYPSPNDAAEHERLNLQSAAIDEMMHGKYHHAPLNKPSKILEVGSGTGAITRKLANQHPSASVISNDISPIPDQERLPRNVACLQGDFHTFAGDETVFPPGYFDYIFSRMLVYGMTDWREYIAQAKSLLAPGGYLELQELDVSRFWDADQNPLPRDAYAIGMELEFMRQGLVVDIAPKLAGLLRNAGFVNVEVKEFRWMFGEWPGHPETENISAYSTKYLGSASFDAYKRILGSGKTPEHLAAIERKMLRYFSEKAGKHQRFWVVVGKKA
ncbi:unnamed protein product [Zymoseptoria tritici ST99CH_3D1]|nr:unnamed protein product [Zymoseptoria tritici ST99CH_3D1]